MKLVHVTRTAGAAALLTAAFAIGVALTPHAASARTAGSAATSPQQMVRASGPGAGRPASGTGRARRPAGIFTEHCGYARTANIDPILMPGMTGMSMAHDFFGNTAVTAGSTAATLTGGATTCGTSADSSAYWTPVLYQNGVALHPTTARIYWRAQPRVAAQVHTMPAGLSMIAGNESAVAPQGLHRVAWSCTRESRRGAGSGRAPAPHRFTTPPSCGSGQRLLVTITFPSCWDGHHLNGADQRNVAYPGARDQCPAGYPIRIPELVFHAAYPATSAAGLSLSTGMGVTGSVNSEHADFINAFAPAPLAADVHRCINLVVRCGPVRGPGATPTR